MLSRRTGAGALVIFDTTTRTQLQMTKETAEVFCHLYRAWGAHQDIRARLDVICDAAVENPRRLPCTPEHKAIATAIVDTIDQQRCRFTSKGCDTGACVDDLNAVCSRAYEVLRSCGREGGEALQIVHNAMWLAYAAATAGESILLGAEGAADG